MEKIFIVCIDDQREVLNALMEDLAIFEKHFELEECESAGEALDVIESIDQEGDFLGVVISDHVMPGMTGVELLAAISSDGRFPLTRKVLLTGLATHKDTIEAINSADLDRYIEKPWNKEDLIKMVKTLVTQYILKKGIDYEKYLELLDNETLYSELRKG